MRSTPTMSYLAEPLRTSVILHILTIIKRDNIQISVLNAEKTEAARKVDGQPSHQ